MRKNICKLNKINCEKLSSLINYDGEILVGISLNKLMNPYGVSIGKDPEIKKVLMIGRLKNIDNDDVYLEVPKVNEYDITNNEVLTHIKTKVDALYELTAEIFVALTNGADKMFIDDDGTIFIEEGEYNNVFALVGKFKKYKEDNSFDTDKEINGIFIKKEDAVKMGEMLKNYGRLNDIEYTDYEIHNFFAM